MKQLHKILISAAIALSILAPGGAILAQEGNDLGVQSSGLLPSNPFYFLKEWGRGFRKLITVNSIKKASLELDVLNEKAAELKKLQEITDGSDTALGGALSSYIESAEQLSSDLASIKESSDPGVSELVENIINRSLRHFRLLNDLSAQPGVDEKLKTDLDLAIKGLVAAIGQVPGKLIEVKDFNSKFLEGVDELKDSFKELRSADLADRLTGEVPEGEQSDIGQLREDLLLKFSGRLEGSALAGGSLGDLSEVSGNQLERLRLIDEIRERILNPQLRSELNIIRQKILEKASEKDGIKQEQARDAIIDAQNILTTIEDKISAMSSVKSSIKELIERAKFNLSQADQFMAQENFGAAFGQATAAQAALKGVMNQLSVSDFDAGRALESTKKSFDYLFSKAGTEGLTKEANPKVFVLLADAEKKIVALDKLIQINATPENVASSLRSIKILLATIEELLAQIAEPKPAKESEVIQAAPVNEIADFATRREAKRTSVLQADSTIVVITEKGFEPSEIKISQGTKIVWINKDIRPHWPAIVSSQVLPGFDALQGLSQGESYSFVFSQIGNWKYSDKLNPGLVGVVEVAE